MSRLFLVEDDLSLVDGLTYSLKKNGFEVEVAHTVREAVSGISMLDKYDLLILDVTLPDGTGFEICEKIRKQNQTIPIIFLTASDEEVSIIRGLDSGGDDYITKPFGMAELRARVNAHLRRDMREKKNSFSISGVVFQLNAKEAQADGQKLPFTKGEYEICEYLALHHGQTFTREQIYEAVFGYDAEGDSSVISSHIKNIRAKLAACGLSPIETVWGVGYKWV